MEDWGAVFMAKDTFANKAEAYQVFSVFPESSEYLDPSPGRFMINFMVENLIELLAALKEEGVEVIDKTEEGDFGKFGWVIDPDGNKIELWQPV